MAGAAITAAALINPIVIFRIYVSPSNLAGD
jgi:hypothetical protein